MLTLPNILTLLRMPLALAFLQENVVWRGVALILAMLSDGLDGYYARRYGSISRVGAFLDPMTDRFFVFFVLTILLWEQRLGPWEAATMLCRDFSVMLFGCYLAWKGVLGQYQFRAIWCGKATTCLQFLVVLALCFDLVLPSIVFNSFIFLGFCALIELYLQRTKLKIQT